MANLLQHTYCPFFFFNDTATTEIYTLSLHDALPIFPRPPPGVPVRIEGRHKGPDAGHPSPPRADRKSTRLNSSHSQISYAVFCLKKKKHRAAGDQSMPPKPIPHISHDKVMLPSAASQ